MNPRQMHYETLAGTIIKNLARRRMEGYYCATVEDAEKMAFSFLTPGCTVSFGGSMTLEYTGMLTALRHDPGITLLDRAHAKTPEETKKIYHDALSSDFYFMSTNAITKYGELVNIDGTGNRVAATLFGHEKVYFVIGRNKLAPTYEAAVYRARNVAAPQRARQLGKKTPCAVKADRCYDCRSPERVCRALVTLWGPMLGMETEVLLVDEDLGL